MYSYYYNNVHEKNISQIEITLAYKKWCITASFDKLKKVVRQSLIIDRFILMETKQYNLNGFFIE
jgi:hypothetical protein